MSSFRCSSYKIRSKCQEKFQKIFFRKCVDRQIEPWQGERTKETTLNRPKVLVRWADKKEARQIRNTVLRLGLDRRKVYSLAWDDVLGTMESFVGACSGCSCDCHPGCSHGAGGCSECGYTGKRTVRFVDPVVVNGQFVTTGKEETTDEHVTVGD